jgi:DNA-directed RNA polymerase specialized sigma24 family protein
MAEREWLTEQFEGNRTHLRAVAYRMLGSVSEADDAVQEAWLRLNRSGAADVENLRAWLTTVVARVPRHVALTQVAARGPARPVCRGAARRLGRARPARGVRRQREVVDAFLAAARGGDFDALVACSTRRSSSVSIAARCPAPGRGRSGAWPR